MLVDFILLLLFLAFLIKSADWAIKYSTLLAETLNISKFIIGFIIVAIISILPETFISLTSALSGVPEFGLGTLFGSNIADLTLIIAIIIFVIKRPLKVESKIIKNQWLQIGIILTPLLLGFDGEYTRLEGAALLISGLIFYYFTLKGTGVNIKTVHHRFYLKNLLLLIVSMLCLIVASHFTVSYGIDLARELNISPLYIGMFMVGIGTTLPEFLFSLHAAKNSQDSLALGDILGTVTADATIVVGLLAIISPFVFPQKIIYITGIFMMVAIVLLFQFMKSGKVLSRKEGFALFIFYLLFVLTEMYFSR